MSMASPTLIGLRSLPRVAHLLSVADLDPSAIAEVLEEAERLKAADHRGIGGAGVGVPGAVAQAPLAGRAVALLFHKPSLRTRVSFEVGVARLGGRPVVVSGAEVGIGTRESVEDIARTLSRYVDAIVGRVLRHEGLERLAGASDVPVINALTDREHPCQALADLMTMREHLGTLAGRRVAFVGDGNNVAHSLLLGAASAGMDVRIATPPGYEPADDVVDLAVARAAETGGRVSVGHDASGAVGDADAVYTDVWAGMGQEAEAEQRRRAFAGFGVTRELLRGAPEAIVLHCLPAHRGEEIDADVIDGRSSVVFDQAENRMWAQMAVLSRLVPPLRAPRERGGHATRPTLVPGGARR